MFKFKNIHLLSLMIFIYSILVSNLSYPKKVSPNSEQKNSPGKLENSSYVVMSFMKDIGYPQFFKYEELDRCIKNYNYSFYNTCYINKDDIVEFVFKKEFKNLDSFLSNIKSQQMEYLLSVDLSNLIPMIKDVTSMNYMFKGCRNLRYINFGDFDASKVTSMISMFEGCSSLISINLSYFDTSNVIDMSSTFINCISLKILDISNFNMEKVTKYNNMFKNLTALKYINIYNIKKDKNKIIGNTFQDNENLIIVCQNEKIISNPNAIYKCCNFNIKKDNCDNISTTQINSSLTELISEKTKDIRFSKSKPDVKYQKKTNNNFSLRKTGNIEPIKLILLSNDHYEKNDLRVSFDIYFVTTNNSIDINYLNFNATVEYSNSELGSNWQNNKVNCASKNNFQNNKFSMPCSLELDNSNLKNIKIIPYFNFDLDNIEVSLTPSANIFFSEWGFWDDTEIYILENSYFSINRNENLIISGVINGNKPDFINEKLILAANDLEIEKNYSLLNCTIININNNDYTLNCYINKNLNIDLQSSMVFIGHDLHYDDFDYYSDILIINFDDYNSTIQYNYSGNNFDDYNSKNQYNNCSGIQFFNDECTPASITNSKDIIVSDFIYGILEEIEKGEFNDIFNRTIAENKTTIKSENNVTYEISTVLSQYSTNYSTVGLEDCESKLKDVYSLDENDKLILLKVEYGIEKYKIPIIEYQLFTKNGTRLELNYCDIVTEIVIPVNIEKEFIHNPNSDFYKDKCYTYTTEYGTDLCMYDRKNYYNKKYYALCEKNCEFKEYNGETKKVKCKCKIKTEFPKLPNNVVLLNELLHQFVDIIKHSNLFLFKCYKKVFSFEGLKKNSGSYINIIMIAGIIFYSIFFGIKGYDLYINHLNNIISKREMITPKNPNKNNNQKNETFSINDNAFNDLNNTNITNISDIGQVGTSTLNIPNCSNNINNTNNKKNINISNISNIIDNRDIKDKLTKSFNDFEMNNLKYKEALVKDKRTFLQTYKSLMKTKQKIYFTFLLEDDYNSKIIKICLFIFSLSLDYAVGAMFFHDGTMHKIDEDKGDYNFTYQLSKTIITFLISYYITKLVSCFILSEEKISKIIENNISQIDTKSNNLFDISKCKLSIFFVLITLFHLLFWYYLSAFCAVYKNTQVALILNTIQSIFDSLVTYPVIICFILCIMRRCALKAANKDKEFLYNLSNKLGDIFL